MDLTSASSSTSDAGKRSSNVSHPPTGASQVTFPMNGLTSSQGITAATVPVVQSNLVDPSFQPSAQVFRSGIAFDYDNFPRILSVCWPVFNIDTGMPLLARDGPERSLTHIPTNETITYSNDVPLSGGSVFTWGPSHSGPVVKDPVISTPEKKAPIGIAIRDSCEIQTKTVISNTKECVKTTSERQEEATTVPHVSQKHQGSSYEPAESTTIKKVEITEENHLQEISFDKIQLNANKKRSDSEEATSSKDLGHKNTRSKPVQAALRLSTDNKQSGFKTQEMLSPANFESEPSDHESHCIQLKERPNVEDCEHDTMATSKESKISPSSAETKRVEEDNSDCKAKAEANPLVVSSNLRIVENAPIVKEDNVVSAASKTDHSEESYVFCSSPPRQSDSDSNHSTVTLQQCSRLENEDKQENVRDLIARIKYIKSRLDRAESDYRKKRMLKAIIGLQKRVKALFKDMKKEKVDPAKEQQGTNSYNEERPGHELANNTVLESQGTNRTGRELPTDHVITDQGDLLLLVDVKQASKDSSKGNTGRETQQSCKELTMVSPPDVIASHDNVVTSSETKTEDKVKFSTFRHSKDGDINCKNNNNNNNINNNNNTNNNNNNNRRQDRGSLSLITSNGSVDELSLRLPFGIGLDCPPCRKRAASSPELDENDLPKDQSSKAKKMKRLPLSDEDVKKIHPRFQDFTHHTQSVTQDGSELNERNKGHTGVWVGINILDDAATTFNADENKSDADVEMIELHEQNSCSEEMQDVTFSFTPAEDNSNGQKVNHCRSSLENVTQEEDTQGFTSPAIHNPSGRQEDVDLTQSLQIREARIFNLTRKRDKLLNLTGFK